MNELLPHQKECVKQIEKVLKEKSVCYFAGHCRIGKTRAALDVSVRLMRTYGRLLWVTPKNAIESILEDIKDMGFEKELIFVINRESLHKVEGVFDVVVADESHRDGKYPKPSQSCKALRGFAKHATYKILLSGTPSIETGAQLFNQFAWTGGGPWSEYASFYKWFKDYGIPKKIRRAGGMEVTVYDEVKSSVVSAIEPWVVTVTQDDAGFKYKPEIIPCWLENEELKEFEVPFEKDGYGCLEDYYLSGLFYEVVGETPAAKLQKLHMLEGGTLIDEKDEAFTHGMKPFYKVDYLLKRLNKDDSYFISTAYIHERELISIGLKHDGYHVETDIEVFQKERNGVFVGSGISNAEGVDLSWLTGCMIIYSLNWSGSKFTQLIERQNNFLRNRPIKVYCLLRKGGVDEKVFNAVSKKKNFNNTFYKQMNA